MHDAATFMQSAFGGFRRQLTLMVRTVALVLVPLAGWAGWPGAETFNSSPATFFGAGESFAGDKGNWFVAANIGVSIVTDNNACFTGTRAPYAIAQGATLRSPSFSGGIGTVTFLARGSVTGVRSKPSNTVVGVSTDSQCRQVDAVFNNPDDTQIEFIMLNGGVVDNIAISDAAAATVLAIQPASLNPTNTAASLFLVTFSQAVSQPAPAKAS